MVDYFEWTNIIAVKDEQIKQLRAELATLREKFKMNETYNLDPDAAMMPPAEGAAYSNGWGAAKRQDAEIIERLCAELSEAESDRDKYLASARQDAEIIERLRKAVKAHDELLKEIRPDVSKHCYAWFEEQRAALALCLPEEQIK